jgi:hypothetical protein
MNVSAPRFHCTRTKTRPGFCSSALAKVGKRQECGEIEKCGKCGDRLSNRAAREAQEGEITKDKCTGRSTGMAGFIEKLEMLLDRHLKRQKR